MPEKPLPGPRRQEIFLARVEAQDRGLSPAESRRAVAEHFGVSEGQVRQIEREGLDTDWPPL